MGHLPGAWGSFLWLHVSRDPPSEGRSRRCGPRWGDCPFHLLHFHSPPTPALSSCVRHIKPHSYHELSSKSMNSMLKKSPALPCSPPFSVTPGLSRWLTPLHTHAHAHTHQCPRATGEAKSEEGIGWGKSPPLLDKILNPAQLLVEWFAHPDLAL